jgi:broad specificity phosphatase PhoE
MVRHGQAEVFQRESAALSPVGELQARALGEWWLQHRVTFDEVYCGALPRQARTAEIVADCYRTAGQKWPDATAEPAWNEYDATGVLRSLAPESPRLSALAAEFEAARGGPDHNRAFQRMFEAAMLYWLEGSVEAEGFEPWLAFRDRVCGALQRILEGPPGRRVVVFTSGGPIGFAVQHALQAPPRSFLDVNWRIPNCSVTEFLFDRSRFTLDSFNGVSHLEDAALRTYR